MTERENAFEFFGPQTLVGPELKPGDKAPDFSLTNNKMQPVTLGDFAGKPLLLSVAPSLDTSVCSIQGAHFNQEAAALGDKANVVMVTADLPFAQGRWCGANDATNLQTLSDYRELSFGSAYGTNIKQFRLDSRAVFVVDAAGTVRYAEYVPHVAQEPHYEDALDALRAALS